jgi:hypothetical protein
MSHGRKMIFAAAVDPASMRAKALAPPDGGDPQIAGFFQSGHS